MLKVYIAVALLLVLASGGARGSPAPDPDPNPAPVPREPPSFGPGSANLHCKVVCHQTPQGKKCQRHCPDPIPFPDK
ncbi:uncharacterized protein LOC143026664 [Oratosquilla oratoria]|uniref:uncharacterized protein LOC143026664 n=1 Tax=Oratosquilla oratoria TaxID=337810 RepID=UPI003F7713AF